ncbi:MAG: hypothetical protein GC151_14555 [Betaproteobacteria bacterium]|nr:hypothetical protein [Betaproteobacteria bacterium]
MADPVRTRLRARVLAVVCVAVAMLTGQPARAAELVITNAAILKALQREAFSDGRMDLVPASACNHAYLTSPAVVIERGRVVLGAKLTGRAGVQAGTGCLGGLGDTIDIVASGRPFFRDGRIGLEDLRIDQLSNEFYRPFIESLVYSAVGRALDIDVREALQNMLTAGNVPLRLDVERLDVSRLTAEHDRLEITLEFRVRAD